MSSKIDYIKWNLYNKKYRLLLKYGISSGLIKKYDNNTIKKLRSYNYNGLPLSVILLYKKLCNGNCYDCSMFLSLAFKDENYKIIEANIDSLKYNPIYKEKYKNYKKYHNYSNHCFIEKKEKDGSTWVYDTSLGLKINKKLYYMMENPKINKVYKNKQDKTTKNNIINNDTSNDDIVYMIEAIEKNFIPIQKIYTKILYKELKLYKEKINYNNLYKKLIINNYTK